MQKYDLRNNRKVSVQEKSVHFSDFDDMSLVVECDSSESGKHASSNKNHQSKGAKSDKSLENNSRKISAVQDNDELTKMQNSKTNENDKENSSEQNEISKTLKSALRTNQDQIHESKNDAKKRKALNEPIYASTPQTISKLKKKSVRILDNKSSSCKADCELELSVISPIKNSGLNSSLKFDPRKSSLGIISKLQTDSVNNKCVVNDGDVFSRLSMSVNNVLNSIKKSSVAKNKSNGRLRQFKKRSSVKRSVDSKLICSPVVSLERLTFRNLRNSNNKRETIAPSVKMSSSFLCPMLSVDCLQQTFSEAISFCLEENANSAKASVLKQCRQVHPVPFDRYMLAQSDCCKIGEGSYGEVFLFKKKDDTDVVSKIIPVGGSLEINGSQQTTFQEILSEIVLSIVLSSLRDMGYHSSPNFVLVHRVTCLIGKYPEVLLNTWDKFHNEQENGSYNDRPDFLKSDQLFISFEFGNGGTSLETYVFKNAREAVSIFKQVASSLAVAEFTYKFEHRDLHLGNILVASTVDPHVAYTLCGAEFEIESHGVLATIIDFTLSRMDNEGLIVYYDLNSESNEAIFTGEGDYQYDIYRKMKEHSKGNWSEFLPFTNVLWLHYLLKKLVSGVKYKNKRTKMHLHALKELKAWEKEILGYESAYDFVYRSNFSN
ncbi:Serine/threonine-protein kinase haspin [Nymphon striatum]|nr:Serine/threonine-protein kinase haspin [Nymphon striatum]